MFAIIGAAGNVGYSTASALRLLGLPVRAILRDVKKATRLRAIGCEIAIADLQDIDALCEAIGQADTVQIVVPVSPRMEDPVEDLHRSIESLVETLARRRPGRVLAISDYGAHIASDIGMPTIFGRMEERLAQLPGHKVVLRSAEHMHNWARVIPAALASGNLPSFQDPIDMAHPMISAHDLGLIAADILRRPESSRDMEVIHAEGSRRYSANDVAAALSQLSDKMIHAKAVHRSLWKETLEKTMPPNLADLLIKTNDAKNRGGLVDSEPYACEVHRGTTELIDALRALVPHR